MEQYLNVEEVAEILEVSGQTILNWINTDRLECYRVGRHIRITPENILDYLFKLKNPPEAINEFRTRIDIYLEQKRRVQELNEEPDEVKRIELYAQLKNFQDEHNFRPKRIKKMADVIMQERR